MASRQAILRTSVLLAVIAAFPPAALAACPMELAVYSDPAGNASLDFRPTGEGAAVTNTFRMNLREGAQFEGIVMWTDEPRRAHGMVTHKCPEGDVTGEEIAACTVWEGVVYAIAQDGAVSQIPAEGQPAPPRLLFSDFARGAQMSPAYAASGSTLPPDDVFELSGCQE